ncbi:MAG: alpha/beta hydrolase [Candidatus Micrarchaeota archaeon]|nr:alpha/beta hydrolase [Candidatus Micrarchaeota archaeon]
MDKARVFIAPGYLGVPSGSYRPWLKQELEALDFEVSTPMVISSRLEILESVALLSGAVGKPDENTYIVAQSAAVPVLLNYLHGLDEKTKIGGSILISGFTTKITKFLSNFSEAALALDYNRVRRASAKFEIIHHKDDNWVLVSEAYHLRRKIPEAKLTIVTEPSKDPSNHFVSVERLPQALQAVLRMNKIRVPTR